MNTPESSKIGTTPKSRFEDSPIFNFINNLSPIQPVKSTHEVQVFQSLSFASISAVFSSPQVTSPKESRFLTRHTYSSSPQLDISSNDSDENTQPIAFNNCKITCLLNKASFDIPEENSTQPAQSSQPIQFECDSPDHSIKPCYGIKNKLKIGSSVSHAQVEVQYERNQVTKIHEEDLCDRDNAMSNIAENLLIFDDNTEQETCILNEENDLHYDYKSSMLMISELEPSLHNGGVKEHTTDHSPQMLSNTYQNPVPSNNINKEVEEHNIGISKGCKAESQQQRGTKRRCLSFDLSKASINNPKIDIDNNKSVGVKQGSSSSPYVLPSIGLHLNTLATSQYDSMFISPILSVRTGDKFFRKLNVKQDKCPTDSEGQSINVDTSEATEFGFKNNLSQSSPKKKRKLEGGESEGCKRCNCKKSKCLKLYCECFHAGIYCVEPCSCKGCFNKPIHEEIVLATRKQIESRNPLAFAPKVIRASESVENTIMEETNKTPASARHKTGCNCKKSSCLKKYCECFQGGVGCSLSCRCESCKNVFGRKDVLSGYFLLTVEEIENTDVHEKEHGKLHNDDQIAIARKIGDHPLENMLPNTPSFGISRPLIASSSLLPNQKPPRSRALKKCEVPPLSNITNEVKGIYETSKDIFSPKDVAKNISPNGKRVSPPRKVHEMLPNRKGRKLVLEVVPPFPSLNIDMANENESTFI